MPIMRNQVYDIQAPADTVRIIALLEDNRAIVISMTKKDTLPYELPLQTFIEAVKQGDATLNHQYPTTFFSNPTEKQVLAAEEAWKIIGPFVQDEPDCYDKKIRSRFIAAKAKETGLQRKQIQRLLYRYWAGGMTQYALYPDFGKRGAPGKSRNSSSIAGRPVKHEIDNIRRPLNEHDMAHIRTAINKYYNKEYGYDLRRVYQKLIKDYYTDSVTELRLESYPTENQFRYRAVEFIDIKKRAGSVIYNKDLRGITGSSRGEARGPGDVYQIDATVVDLYLVSRNNRHEVVGRPELYFVTDVFSRMIVGFYVCLESASWENARYALLNAFNDKVSFCEKFGISIQSEDWPCCGLPRALIVDNGELISKKSSAIIKGLNIEVKNAPAWRPDLKGIVENKFHLLHMDIKPRVSGAVQPDFSARTGRDYREDACLDLFQFTQILIHFVLKYNKRLMSEHPQPFQDVLADNVPAIPLELWHWGVAHRTGVLRQETPENLEVALSEEAEVTVTKKGISFKRMYYTCATAGKENWFSKAREKGGWKINIKYNPQDTGIIYLPNRFGGYEKCWRTNDSASLYPGLTLEEVNFEIEKLQLAAKRAQGIQLQNEIDYNRNIDAILKEAHAQKNAISTRKIKNDTKHIKENRKKEAASIRAEQQVSPPKEKGDRKPEIIDFPATKAYDYGDIFASIEEEDP